MQTMVNAKLSVTVLFVFLLVIFLGVWGGDNKLYVYIPWLSGICYT